MKNNNIEKTPLSIVKCSSYEPTLVRGAVKKAIDLIGGISKFIKPESKVLIKPNLLMAKEPEFGIDTHPEVVRAVIQLLKEIKCSIFLGDGQGALGNEVSDSDEVYKRSGIKRICDEEGITLIKFEKRRWRKHLPLTTWLDNCDYLINVPKFKTHDLTILTGAIKNLFGLIPGMYKAELHKNYYDEASFSKILVDIYQEARPALTIIDGIVAMEGEGPATTGSLRNLNLLFAGTDCVALDAVLALVMGIKPLDILSTKEASSRGLGTADINSIAIFGEKLEEVIGKEFLLPSTSIAKKIPIPIINLAKKLIKFYPHVEQKKCIGCAACVNACPVKAVSIKNNLTLIDYPKCISCFCCQEFCPESAIKIKKNLFAKLAGL
jgi:uncharacterized protein (DUF362 family)/ferredoxin